MELALGVELILFGYLVYVSMQSPSDFSSQVVVNPRKKAEPTQPPVKAPAAKKEATPAPAVTAPPPAAKSPPPAEVAEPPEQVETVAADAPVEAAVAEAPADEPAPEVQEPRTVVMLKNPATGEIAPLPADYRFAKKWIKDALVSEGLLDRIYKNSELDRKNRTRIREAIERLKAMPKYGA